MTSHIDDARELLKSVINDVENSSVKTSTILMKCIRASKLLNLSQDKYRLLFLEQNGYPIESLHNIPDDTPEYFLPPGYRVVNLLASGPEPKIRYNPPDAILMEQIQRANDIRSLPFVVYEPIDYLESMDHPILKSESIMSKETYRPTVITWVATLSVEQMQTIVQIVRERAYSFASSHLVSLDFGKIVQNIMDETRKYVSKRIETKSADLLKEILETLEKLERGDTDINYRIIVQNCLTFVQRITDLLLTDDMLPTGKERPSTDKTRDKLGLILDWAKEQQKNTTKEEQELVERAFDYFFVYSKSLQQVIDKHRHKDSTSITKEEADRVLVSMFIWLADLFKILDNAEYNWTS